MFRIAIRRVGLHECSACAYIGTDRFACIESQQQARLVDPPRLDPHLDHATLRRYRRLVHGLDRGLDRKTEIHLVQETTLANAGPARASCVASAANTLLAGTRPATLGNKGRQEEEKALEEETLTCHHWY